ncbi:hypothetical protein Baya_9378 [Bagarius yarrelli]|uniref:Uncharacterized protein n=1 Tax=Bagarius yarrelli TaxID=175774 RepID=A0A556U688_BAGYA|nr:hypothetical protein Baya_9378 [Bagarius yarrelli]
MERLSSKMAVSLSCRFERLSHWCLSVTTRAVIEHPTALAVSLVPVGTLTAQRSNCCAAKAVGEPSASGSVRNRIVHLNKKGTRLKAAY